MKKLLVSLTAILAALPMVASAEVVAGDPGATSSTAAAATNSPKYALVTSGAEDGVVATAAYVKGAYNAAIKGINKVQENVDGIQGELDLAEDQLSQAGRDLSSMRSTLNETYATKTGVNATLSAATVSGSFTGATVAGSFQDATLSGSIASATTSATVPTISTWGAESADSTASVTATLASATVTGTASGSISGTASGTVSGAAGSISGSYVNPNS